MIRPYLIWLYCKFLVAINSNFTPGLIFHAFMSSADFFQNQFFQKILSEILSVSNSLDPDQSRRCQQQRPLVGLKN